MDGFCVSSTRRAGDETPPPLGGISVLDSFYQGLAPLAMDLRPVEADPASIRADEVAAIAGPSARWSPTIVARGVARRNCPDQ